MISTFNTKDNGLPLGAFILKSGRREFIDVDVDSRMYVKVMKNYVIAQWVDEYDFHRSAFFSVENGKYTYEGEEMV